jgi:sugar lactone lactonase YvrE
MSEPTATRRTALATGAAALAALAGCSGTDDGTPTGTDTTTDAGTGTDRSTAPDEGTPGDGGAALETVVSIPGDPVPENLAFTADGDLLFGITAGEVRRLAADRVTETGLSLSDTERIATLPQAIGVETAPDGTVYVAVPADGEQSGVWEIPPDGEARQLVGISGFPNDLLFDADRDRLLVTESNGGTVYAVATDGTRSTWLDDDRLDTEGFGANGLTRDDDGTVYVAVTATADGTGRLLEVPVASDGTAEAATTFHEGSGIVGADGITVRDGTVYVAANRQNRVVSVTPDGSVATVSDDDRLSFPSDVAFGTTDATRDSLFVCNFANSAPSEAAIFRTTV